MNSGGVGVLWGCVRGCRFVHYLLVFRGQVESLYLGVLCPKAQGMLTGEHWTDINQLPYLSVFTRVHSALPSLAIQLQVQE